MVDVCLRNLYPSVELPAAPDVPAPPATSLSAQSLVLCRPTCSSACLQASPLAWGGADAAPAAMLTPLFAFQNVHRLMQLKSTQPSHPYPYSQALGRQASQAPDLFWFVSICEVLLAEHTVPCQWRFQPHCVGQSCGLLARSQQPALVQVCPKLCPPC